MGDGMPYWLEKGPGLSVLEDFLSDKHRLQRYLVKLLIGRRITEAGGYEDRSFPEAAKYSGGDVKDHVDNDWFAPNNDYWYGYKGQDVHEIVRQAMIRASCVSLGIQHHGVGDKYPLSAREAWAVANQATRLWPISMFWKCGQSWFETWVTWSGRPGSYDEGSVTVLFATPADRYDANPTESPEYGGYSGGVEEEPVPGAKAGAVPPDKVARRRRWLEKGRSEDLGFGAELAGAAVNSRRLPVGTPSPSLGMAKGMLVVTHTTNHLRPLPIPDTVLPLSHRPRPGGWRGWRRALQANDRHGVDPPDGFYFQGAGPIVVVSPSETWGGVGPNGGSRYLGP